MQHFKSQNTAITHCVPANTHSGRYYMVQVLKEQTQTLIYAQYLSKTV